MTKKKIDDHMCVPWPAHTLIERFENCRIVLMIHGMISEAENEKVKARINKRGS